MGRPLNVIVVDSFDDQASRLTRELHQRANPAHRVSIAEEMSIALTRGYWELVLAGPTLPDRSADCGEAAPQWSDKTSLWPNG